MNELQGVPGELRIGLEIKRKATGETEHVELVTIIPAEAATELGFTEKLNGSDA